MPTFPKYIFPLCLLVFIANSCFQKPSPITADIQSLDLLRGDLILCSGAEFGDVSFSLSCDVDVRETFDLALSLLHSFQYDEAEKAFVHVIDADPDCAMAYWGVAMSIYHAAWFPPSEHQLDKGLKVLSIASSLSTGERETDYLESIGAFYDNWKTLSHTVRAKRYETRMEELSEKYPDDTEAAILYSLALFSTRDRVGKDYVNERKAGKILEALFEEQPNHPGIAHYIIHNYDNPTLAIDALEVARRYASIAPGSAHAQHMPSHIFTRLGLWEESVNSNLNSQSSSRCYAQEAGIEGQYFEEVHAMDYLVYAYLQQGDNQRAVEQYEALKRIEEFYPMNMTAVAYPLAAIPTRIALENKNWTAAANLSIQKSSVDWNKYPWQNAIIHFGRALGAAHMGDFNGGVVEVEKLAQLRQSLIDMDNPTTAIQIDQIEIQIKSAEAWLAYHKGDEAEGIKRMKAAAAMEDRTSKHPVTPGDVLPAEELLGEMLLLSGRSMEALASFEKNLKKNPNRFNGIYGAANAAKAGGDKKLASAYFEKLLELSALSDREELAEAKAYLSQR